MKLLKGIARGIKSIFTGSGLKDITPLAFGIAENIKDIKTDPVKRWEKLGELTVKLLIAGGLLYMLAKGIISIEEVKTLIRAFGVAI